jgi:hypothetical protein
MRFKIYHTTPESFRTMMGDSFSRNVADLAAEVEYELAGTIEAADLNEAFRLTQNDFGTFVTGWSPEARRSTSVGDLIVDDQREGVAIVYVVDHMGFTVADIKLRD